ncbi:anti-sigma regulatory factor [Thermanaeromonas sp. C210]|nr:anti-sigma regulatory factor [Thermanaeromonas sp. C210]
MEECSRCAQRTPHRSCVDCEHFMSPGPSRRKPQVPINISLVAVDGQRYAGRLLVLNTMELGLETRAPVPGQYRIYLKHHLSLDVAGVPTRGKGDIHLFDIIAVHRGKETAGRLGNEEYRLLTGSTGDFIEQVSQLVPAHLQELVKERLLAELERSEIFHAMRLGTVMRYEKGRFRHLAGQEDLELPLPAMESLMRQAIHRGTHCREVIVSDDGKRIFDLHGIPLDARAGGLLAFDLTEIIEKERQMRRQEMLAYREAIAAVTNGRLELLPSEEMVALLSQGRELAKGVVNKATDIASARSQLCSLLPGAFRTRRYGMALSLTEALTNALKHAGGGEWVVRQKEGAIRIIIKDQGRGIKIKDLPKAALMQHYSTQDSLGCGFTLILYYADKVYLTTGTGGTTLVLDFHPSAGEESCCTAS